MSTCDRLDQIEQRATRVGSPIPGTGNAIEAYNIARTDVPGLVAALRAVLAECEDREEVPEDSGSGADAARDIRRMIAAALGEES